MKVSRIFVTVFVVLGLATAAAPAQAEQNFVEQFLNRYRPSPITLPASPSEARAQELADRIQNGQLPLTVGDVVSSHAREQSRHRREPAVAAFRRSI